MEQILNFQQNLDIDLLDRVVMTFYTGVGAERAQAQAVLTQFQDHPDAWQRVDSILEQSKSDNTKYIALSILEKLIQTRWKILPRAHCDGIKQYSSDEVSLVNNRMFLGKLNMILVQILKQEWPKNWPNFMPELIQSSRTSLSLCENNMNILKLLSEEVFDFSAEQMTTLKAKTLKDQFCNEFSQIYQLCSEVLELATKPSLLASTLKALQRFLKWIPFGYIFETNLIELLRDKGLADAKYRNIAIGCLTEIAGLSVGSEYDDRFYVLYSITMETVNRVLPLPSDDSWNKTYENASDEFQKMIQNLAMFLTTFLSTHLSIVEGKGKVDLLINGFSYLLKISDIRERELFKVCLECWSRLVLSLYEDTRRIQMMPLMVGEQGARRAEMYGQVLSNLRHVMINQMAKPEEVLVVEDESGQVVREFIKETDTIQLYKAMKEVLVYLTHLDYEDTERIMTEKLARQVNGSEWSWENLNKLCWAIGSISGAMDEESEKRFLITVIRELLGLVELKRGKDNKAIVAANIMYIVGQYPRFLRAHWRFLKTVVRKLFEFMHEYHEGVRDMACDTFIKIAQKCKTHFVILQSGEERPFIQEILMEIEEITKDLEPTQVHVFYEAIGCMISSEGDSNMQTQLISKLMELPNKTWDEIVRSASQDIMIFKDYEKVKVLVNVLKTNVAACKSIGGPFVSQLGRIYHDLLSVYNAISKFVSESVISQGLIATKTPLVRGMRGIKKETLKFLEIYVEKSHDVQMTIQHVVPPLFDTILVDYKQSVDPAREPEVLNLVSMLLSKLGDSLNDKIPLIFDYLFECTLNMINKDFSDYPDHRVAFFKFIKTVNHHCFKALISLPPQQFKIIKDSVVWAFKHTIRDITDTGLSICYEMLEKFSHADPQISNRFYQDHFIPLLQDIFFVLTDRDHKAGFKMQSLILAHMFGLVQRNAIQVPLFDPVANPNLNNTTFLKEFTCTILLNAFPTLQKLQVETFVLGLFDLNRDAAQFKLHLRDFLIQLKEFSENNDELFREEFELEQERKKIAEKEAAMKVPGLIKPSEMDEMD
ncbi:hypothetical protein ROZALSC1DRAFT_26468 [Rozella allomycis CSF55]|uniref:Exportin-1-like protein n=1 Tax=Rozella allomycis (strain CSF55) TaxID=988480 RepID=A0A075AVN6_ROZAC|nr:Exportin-1-like protein [Rozella allomycis CSF55]RKP22130.1 hypothetical protein ROZALSC1DRAFT_26468 [Rozella allomycis CSF55]|eukprot:EPZ34328.1 Exportin-1-like protein [Rozella allomycis CSF55]